MGSFLRLMRYVAKYWHLFIVSFVLIIINSYLAFIPQLVMRDIFNALTPPFDSTSVLGMLPVACLTIIVASVLSGVFVFCRDYAMRYVSQRALYDLRKSTFDALLSKSFSFYDQSQTGDIISRTTSDIEQVSRMLSMWIPRIAGTISTIIVAGGILFSINYQMTIILLLQVPFVFLITNRYRKLSRPIFRKQRKIFGEITTFLQQNIVGTRVVRIFTQENYEKGRFNDKNTRYLNQMLASAKLRGFYPTLNTLIMSVITAVLWWFGGGLVIDTFGTLMEFKWGDLVLFIQSMSRLTRPISFLSMSIRIYSQAMAASTRVFEVLDAEVDVKDKSDAFNLPSIKGEVKFEQVFFEYIEGKPVLKNINLTAEPGMTIAILGATGSGKSTFINLIPRFYDATSGRLLIDGYDIRDVTVKSVRKQIGIALQEVFLFARTIKENIAFGNPDVSMEEIIEAAKAAQAHDFIMSFPNGYETIVGERGVTLSGGQKQRITIARAILMDPKILILDDTTSFVDTETEHHIQKALETLLKNRTTFVITQRVSTIKNADKIIVLENGEIIESGSHEELIVKNGIYTKIYSTQFAPQEELTTQEIKLR
ncbi:ABC transporter ATP-binding protein [Candidatus Bathyarchaeota archaeon]|nr:ABC transporter ATP-binding protein [Candidatus Bathyarchaeota archaeon]